jgi:hypothetical protein
MHMTISATFNDQSWCTAFCRASLNEWGAMKEKEISDRKELESINDEMFHSFDPDDASWITGGIITITRCSTGGSQQDVQADVDIEL